MTADQSQPVENENTCIIDSENVAEMVRLRIQDTMMTDNFRAHLYYLTTRGIKP